MATAFSRTTDVHELGDVALPYDRFSKELDDSPRLVAGENLWSTPNLRLGKRPGFPRYQTLPHITGRIDRLLIYQTEEAAPKIYILASVLASGAWKLWYLRPELAPGSWTSVGTLRSLDASTAPHEMEIHKGKVYIKGFPSAASGEKLGTVVWDGSGASPTLRVWGVIGPTVPARLASAVSSWPASAHPVTVRNYWKYAYAWKTPDNHMSNRSPAETNPDNLQSTTGPFTSKEPRINVQGNSDTTNFPKVVLFRTLDGGGNFYFLEEVTNTGAGTILYEDDSRVSASGQADPVADVNLDTANIAPSLTSNDPPPPVTDPLVVGTDTPERTTNIISQYGRLWFGIRGNLFYSGLEEIFNGLPEHCWPSGFSGNYFTIGETSVAVENSPTGVVHFSNKNVYIVRGFNRESFAHTLLQTNLGMSLSHRRAHCSYQNTVFWMTSDFRIFALVNEQPIFLSRDLGSEIENSIAGNTEIELKVFSRQEKQYLLVLLADKTNGTLSKLWVYDLVLQRWNTPWTGSRQVALAIGRPLESVETVQLLAATFNGSTSALTYLNFTEKQDYLIAGTTNYALSGTTNSFRVPLGNHMNPLRRPVVVPDIHAFILTRVKFDGDTDPAVSYLLDDYGQSYSSITAESEPPRRPTSTYFREHWYMLNEARARVSIKIDKSAANEDFDLQALALSYRPEAGV